MSQVVEQPLAKPNAPSQQQAEVKSSLGRAAKRRQRLELIGAIDQGTSSTRFLVFENGSGRLLASSQVEIKRITPQEGWVEIDPMAIMSSVYATIANVHEQLKAKQLSGSDPLKCIGICNQRESAVVWDKLTGEPLYNVIVWMDNRTKDIVDSMIDSVPGRDFNHLKDKTGLPMSTYFSAFKLKWLMESVPEVREAAREQRLLFGTVDAWILWNLTGNHLTDVTNASRTFLMDIETLDWDKQLCKHFGLPMHILPKILSSADDFGRLRSGPFEGTPVTGVIGDQSAALFGHNCLQLGQTKATFGTGCFIMQNIGPGPLNGALSGVQREAKRGLITTVGFKLRDRPVCYALEGSIKIAGAALTWLRDNMQLIENYEECDQLVNKTTHSAGVFFVPALGGLYSPYWDPNAAGLYIGLSQFTRREHLVRATFDSIAFQTNDILSLMRGVANGLMIDGGLCKSDNLCQILADITGYDIVRPSMCETSALGAAMVAGCGAGIWSYESMLASSRAPGGASGARQHQHHHYPHESLHQEERFASSSLLLRQSFKSSQSRQAGGQQGRPGEGAKHRRLRHRAGASNQQHLLSNATNQHAGARPKRPTGAALDAGGGGVNDDAGGGGREAEEGEGEGEEVEEVELSSHPDEEDRGAARCLAGERDQLSNCVIESEGSTGGGGQPKGLSENYYAVAPAAAPAAPSSGYSSGDNFELATLASNSLPDPSNQRADSPSSMASVATCADLSASRQPAELQLGALGAQTPQVASSRCNAWSRRQQVAVELAGGQRSVSPSSEVDEEEEEEEVHAFGGRDSFGEDGYDSSTVSFESEVVDDDENDDDEPDEGQDGDETGREPAGGGSDGSGGRQDSEQRRPPSTAGQGQEQWPGRRSQSAVSRPVDVFESYISLEHRTDLVENWRRAVERSMKWTKVHHEEVRRIDYQRLASLPISMYLFLSVGLVALSGLLSAGRAH